MTGCKNMLMVMVLVCLLKGKGSQGFGTFGFDVHHRYSDTVKDYLAADGLPEKGTLDYYAAMAHRDQFFKARRLSTSSTHPSLLTFSNGNETFRLSSLGFLHYSIVSVGTPPLRYLVALDTGSDLFWLPCDCTSCIRSLNLTDGTTVDLNIYSPSNSSSSVPVACNSTMCAARRRRCSLRLNACAYQEVYLSSNTSTTGILVDDILHLVTDDTAQSRIEAPITLGCGMIQTGDFLDGAGINGLFGLGMDNVSVPSILASKGLTANSFSMCFGRDGLGRIDFGDKGSPDQQTTPFNLRDTYPTYNITVTQVIVGENTTDVKFTAIFDSGTSFTYLNDPAYTVIAESFNSQVQEQPYQPETNIIFDYCYALSSNQDSYDIPILNLTMGGGSQFYVTAPTVVIPRRGGYAYCLAMVKSEDLNIIGQNFMTGYRIVFDREEMVLGWKESDCNDSILSRNGSSTLPIGRRNSTNAPPPSILDPEATPANRTRSPVPSNFPSRPGVSRAASCSSFAKQLLMVVFSILFHQFIILDI